ncbi:hypothetical protein [Alicyclobacillus ferrooxydans]|uniref:Uncharacterized protein n=1 Tax=Alicyclobacillus ferrooxydans TaxID=471514 RepID=A0A0P9CHA0_9BACL|nr:hypothetical protein [Alicyclobacillus ferrooxydans]KPV42423.1 hypothetical protein AN477_17660 [Alicyclobacillus ferrooxydans]
MDKRPDSQLNGIELNEAAALMESTAEALRKKIQRGSLQGYKVDGRWYVVLPNEYGHPDDERIRWNDVSDGDWGYVRTLQNASQYTIQAYESHISSLQSEIEFLRRQVATLTQDGLEKNRTINGLAQRLTELPEVSQTTMHEQEALRNTVERELAATRQFVERAMELEREWNREKFRILEESAVKGRDEVTKPKSFWRRLLGD